MLGFLVISLQIFRHEIQRRQGHCPFEEYLNPGITKFLSAAN